MNAAMFFAIMACAGPLAACGAAPAPRAAPPAGPQGFVLANPPADSSFTPLRCVPAGPGLECSRKP